MNIINIFSFNFNPIALSFAACGIINIIFAAYLVRKINYSITIFWFVLFTIVIACADLSNAFLNMSNTAQGFSFWLIVNNFLIILPAPLLFTVGISFANKTGYLKKLWIVIPSLSIFFIMLFLSVNTNFIFSHNVNEAVKTPWGISPKGEAGNAVVGLYFLLTQIVYLSVLLNAYFTNTDKIRKKQIRLMMFAIIFTTLITTITKGFLPQIFHWEVFPSDIYIELVLVITAVYVLSRYGISALNIDSVSEKLLQLIPSSVVILNKENIIELINPSAETLFQVEKEKLIGSAMKDFFISTAEYDKFIASVISPLEQNIESTTKLNEGKIISKEKKGQSVDIQATIIKDSENKNVGILVIFTSIQQILDQASELEERFQEIEKQKTELERMNKFMVNREIKMTELKKENDELRNKITQGTK